MKRQPKQWNREKIITLLDSSDKAIYRGILVIQSLQTAAEQLTDSTHVNNAQGWSGVDAQFMSGLAKGLRKYGRLTPKQLPFARKKMHKYARQLAKVANGELVVTV